MQRRTPPEENIPLIVLKPFTRRAASAPPQTPAAQAAGPNAAHEAWIRGIKEVMHFPEDKVFLAQLQARGVTVLAYDRIYFENPYYQGVRGARLGRGHRDQPDPEPGSAGGRFHALSRRHPRASARWAVVEGG
jgi:hypothetical protein